MNALVLCTLYRLGRGEAGMLAQMYMTEVERCERIAHLKSVGLRDVIWVPPRSLKALLRAHDEEI